MNQGKLIRILVSAHDFGSALQSKAFIKFCLFNAKNTVFFIFCRSLTYQVFKEVKIDKEKIKILNEKHRSKMDKDVHEVLQEFQPHFILVGMSSYSPNIDEMILMKAKAKGIPCASIQDYWGGYTGKSAGQNIPNYFFVFNEASKLLCNIKYPNGVSCIVTGSPKHEKAYFLDKIYKLPRKKKKKKVIVFFGQPSNIPGYLFNVKLLVEALNHLEDDIEILVKPHPQNMGKESICLKLFESLHHPFQVLPALEKTIPYLINADLVVTCFSTIGIDHNYLQLYFGGKLGNLLYIMVGEEILDFIEKDLGTRDFKNLVGGMGRIVNNKDEILKEINGGLNNKKLNREYYKSVVKNLNLCPSPSSKIWNFIEGIAVSSK